VSRTVTLLELRTAVHRRGGTENSADLTTAVVNEFINEGIARLWDLLKSKRDDRLIDQTTIPYGAGAVNGVDLGDEFYELRKVEIVDASAPAGYRMLRKVDLDAAHLYATVTGKRYRYMVRQFSLILVPTPTVAETVRVWYVPVTPILSSDVDTLEGYSGYERLVIRYAYKQCLERQRLDTSEVEGEIQFMETTIKGSSDGRDPEPFYLDPRGADRVDLDDDYPWGPF
jgi:hypothetical protein